MKFVSTRDASVSVDGSYAIAHGISAEGGLYVPESFPQIGKADMTDMAERSYEERAAFILSKFLTEYSYEELLNCTRQAYARFDGDPAPLVKMDESTYILELWHGPTSAFKDMALTLLPHLLVAAKEKQGIREDVEIAVATSGDTGKAALEGFRDVAGTSVVVFYPSDGVSEVQKLQMTTQEGRNVYVAGVTGNFDDCQSAVKRIFASSEVAEALKKRGVVLSSANSINFGRLAPQIAYYFSAYADLLECGDIEYGEKVNFCVPTGNFGNILAAYYAKRMGLPVGRLICASNSNNILTDFFETGEYNVNREFFKTISPSMDILISSNLERLLFEFTGRNGEEVSRRMAELAKSGVYRVERQEQLRYQREFYADFTSEEETEIAISDFFDEYDYPLDPHTAVAVAVYNGYVAETGDETKTVIVSTASPYKFAQDVLEALMGSREADAFKAVKKLYAETAMEIPENIRQLADKKVRFTKVYPPEKLAEVVTLGGEVKK